MSGCTLLFSLRLGLVSHRFLSCWPFHRLPSPEIGHPPSERESERASKQASAQQPAERDQSLRPASHPAHYCTLPSSAKAPSEAYRLPRRASVNPVTHPARRGTTGVQFSWTHAWLGPALRARAATRSQLIQATTTTTTSSSIHHYHCSSLCPVTSLSHRSLSSTSFTTHTQPAHTHTHPLIFTLPFFHCPSHSLAGARPAVFWKLRHLRLSSIGS